MSGKQAFGLSLGAALGITGWMVAWRVIDGYLNASELGVRAVLTVLSPPTKGAP